MFSAAPTAICSRAAPILPSGDASLLEGLVSGWDHQLVVRSFLVSLSHDLLKHTQAKKEGGAQQRNSREKMIETIHSALTQSRRQARRSKQPPQVGDHLAKTVQTQTTSQAGKDLRTPSSLSSSSSSSSLLLQMSSL